MHRFLLILPLLLIPFCSVQPVYAENLTTYAGEMRSNGSMPPCLRCGRPYLDHIQTSNGQLMCPDAWFGRRQPNQPFLPRPQNPILPRPNPAPTPDGNPYETDPIPIPGLIPSAPAPGVEPSEPEVVPAEPVTPKPTPVEEEKSTVGFFGRIRENVRERVNNFTGGVLTVVGLGMFALIVRRLWYNVLRKKVVKYVDKGQDLVELWVEQQRGPGVAKEVRDILEDLESGILSYVDQYVNGINTTKNVAMQSEKQKLRTMLNVKDKQPTVDELVAAIREAARQVGGEEITHEIPAKVQEILEQQKMNVKVEPEKKV